MTKRKDLILGVDVSCATTETRVMPAIGSPCHRMMQKLVAESGWIPKRKRMRMPKQRKESK